MRIPSWKNIIRWPAARLSAAVLYVLLGVAAVVFVLYYLVGFSRLSAEDPNFTEPRLTLLLLVFLWVMLGLALVMAVVSVVRSLRVRDKQQSHQNGIPVARIAVGTGCGLAVCLLLTFVLGSSRPMLINGLRYADAAWLKTADMFINTAIVLLLVAVIAVVCSNVRNARFRR